MSKQAKVLVVQLLLCVFAAFEVVMWVIKQDSIYGLTAAFALIISQNLAMAGIESRLVKVEKRTDLTGLSAAITKALRK